MQDMKITPKELKQIIKEELGQLTNEAGKYVEDPYKDVDTSETIHDAAFDSLVLGHGIGADLRDRLGRIDRDSAEELQAIYVGLMKAAHSAREFIEQNAEAIQEVYSEKQRRWACAQTGDDFKGDKKLTDKEAEEMCSSPIEEKENTMKLTVESLKQIIKEELGMDQEGEGGAPEENVALDNLTAAVDSLVQNLGYTIEEVLEIVQGLGESSGVSVAMKDDEVVATMADIAEEQELEECGYPEPEEEEPKRYFEI
jgi:hypothetical protein